MIKEPNWRDPIYLAKLIIICNAIDSNNRERLELPFYFEKHYNYVKDVFPQFIEKSKNADSLWNTHETAHYSLKFFSLMMNYFLNLDEESSLVDTAEKFKEIFMIISKMKNLSSAHDCFVQKLSKYLLNLITFRKSFSCSELESEINYHSLIKIMKGIFKLQERYSNIGKLLLIFMNMIKFECFLLLPLHLFQRNYLETFESGKLNSFLVAILNSSVDFQHYLNELNITQPDLNNSFKVLLILFKSVISFPQKLNDSQERRIFYLNYQNLVKSMNIFELFKESSVIPKFPVNLIQEKIVLFEPSNNLEESIEIDSKFIAKVDVVFDLFNIRVTFYF